MKHLVIVESPTKAKTIGKFLGSDYKVESSYGHVRDLPKSKMGVDFDNNFEPQYVVPLKARARVDALKKLASKAKSVFFATDQDREGEAIAWHLLQLLKIPKKEVKRIAFHEITKKAVAEALEHPHAINQHLVDAQQARRILDRLVGYELSPFLWKKVARGLSAGRVQSVAVRLIVEREREIEAFKPQEYWTVEGTVHKASGEGANIPFDVNLHGLNGKALKKFDLKADEASKAVEAVSKAKLSVTGVESKTITKTPPPPFTTSTLQQEANRRLGYSAKQTMMLAQQLYEGVELGDQGSVGLITYMRTDSFNLSQDFLQQSKNYIEQKFGQKYVTAGSRQYKTKSKLAQEAHEAIRPTDANNSPETVKAYLDSRQLKLYSLIWSRAMATQMAESSAQATGVDIEAIGTPYTLRATGLVRVFDGWQKVYPASGEDRELPPLKTGDALSLEKIDGLQHFTQPPARYSEAGLVKALEERGIGRPSTYAPTIATIVERKYVEKIERRLKPTDIGTLVNDLLTEHFPEIVDYDFTADMEKNLDLVAEGDKPWQPIIKAFYVPFKKNLEKKAMELNKKDITEQATDEVCDKCGKPMVIKVGRFGKFLACTGYPECKNTKQLNSDGQPAAPETTDEKCEKCGRPMIMRHGRFGPFLGCSGYPECKNIKSQNVGTGVTCPDCGKGEIVAKRSRSGKTFYSCNRYPECKFALWQKPNGEKCPTCGSLLVFAAGNKIRCSKKDCGYQKEAATEEDTKN